MRVDVLYPNCSHPQAMTVTTLSWDVRVTIFGWLNISPARHMSTLTADPGSAGNLMNDQEVPDGWYIVGVDAQKPKLLTLSASLCTLPWFIHVYSLY